MAEDGIICILNFIKIIKMKLGYYFIVTIFLMGFANCSKNDDQNTNKGYVIGKNNYTINIDGDEREYVVSVPKSYTGESAFPVVIMLHGTSGDGERFYNISGWKEVGESEGIITVFPSSWRYCINKMGEINNTTKWNTVPDCEWSFCPNEKGKDDIKFLRSMINEINKVFNIDNDRIYLNGFSNGGQMAAKCAIEMSDVLAAVGENAGSFYLDTTYIPKRNLPTFIEIGDRDYGPENVGPSAPLQLLDTILATPGLPGIAGRIHKFANSHIRNFLLAPAYTITGDTTLAVKAKYLPANGSSTYEFDVIMVKNLGHIYPNGQNHPFRAAVNQWAWFKQFKLH